jgi:spore coat-associated protein N
MSLKKKAALSMASLAMGAMAVMGGTFAYFSDTSASANTFSTGTLNLSPSATYLEKFNIVNFKPGDKLIAEVDNQEPALMLNNQGTLPFDIFMKVDAPASTYDALKDVLVFEKLYLGSEATGNLLTKYFPGETEVTLREVAALFGTGNAVVNGNTISNVGKYIGYLDADNPAITTEVKTKGLKYVIKFKDTGVEQNDLQGKAAGINFSFTALQYNGENIDQGAVNDPLNNTFERNDDINDRTNSGNN